MADSYCTFRTSGTSTLAAGLGPLDMVSSTTPYRLISPPPSGFCSQTVSLSAFSQNLEPMFLILKSPFSPWLLASAIVLPTRLGTATMSSFLPPPNSDFPMKIAPTSTSIPATISRIVERLLFLPEPPRPRPRSGRSS